MILTVKLSDEEKEKMLSELIMKSIGIEKTHELSDSLLYSGEFTFVKKNIEEVEEDVRNI